MHWLQSKPLSNGILKESWWDNDDDCDGDGDDGDDGGGYNSSEGT